MDILDKRIKDFPCGYRRNIALIGRELTGKTTLLNFSLSRILNERIIPLYINFQGLSFEDFSHEFICSLLTGFLKKASNFEGKPKLSFLLNQARPLLPKTCARIDQISILISKKKFNDAFKELIQLMDCLAEEKNLLILAVFDEFHYITDFPLKNAYKEWGKIICLQKNVLYVLSSSACFKAKIIMAQDLQLLFGNFEVIDVLPFDQEKSSKFILKEIYPLKINPVYTGFLADFLEGLPCFLKLAGSTITKNALLANLTEVNSEIFKRSLEEIIYRDMGVLNQQFTNQTELISGNRFGKSLIQLLIALSKGNSRLKDLCSELKSSSKNVSLRMDYLLAADLVVKNGNFFKISNKMFSFWLKSIYEPRIKRLEAGNRYKVFYNDLCSLIENYISTSKQNITDRITELFNLFTDGIIQVEAKSLKLSHFREIKPFEFDSGKGIVARAAGVLWLTAVKEGNIKEEDIVKFSIDCKKFKFNKPKKVIVGCDSIETNAKIVAKQENILIIDKNNLNNIFNLYNRPGIIRVGEKNENFSII